jgi:Recombination endonuclease VII
VTSGRKPTKKERYAEDLDYRQRTRAYNRAWHAAHKEEVNALRRRRWTENSERRTKQRSYRARNHRKDLLKYYYGMSVEDYDAFLARQRGACAICMKPSAQTLCVDHCHATGKVRGLLCRKCNLGIGHLGDDPNLLRAAIGYLEAAQRS